MPELPVPELPVPGDDQLAEELRDLGRALAVPPGVDHRDAVRARLARPARRRPRVRLALAAGVAALVAAVTLVAPARAAVVQVVGDLLRVAGVVVRLEPANPEVPPSASPLPSARPASLAEADRLALFPVRLPADLGDPEQVELADPDQSGAPRVVSLFYRGGAVRLDQFDGGLEPAFFKMTPDARWAELGTGLEGVWLEKPHPVIYVGRDGVRRTETARLAGPALIWASSESITYRLEGIGTLEEATAVARSVR